jgi:hypothetical protein
VAARAGRLTAWGPIRLDGKLTRVAIIQTGEDNGTPVFGFLVDGDAGVVVVTASAWGFPELQGPFIDGELPWGAMASREGPLGHTIDLQGLTASSHWIHASRGSVSFTLEHGKFVVLSEAWNERENNGHGFDESSGGATYPAGHHPPLAGHKAHAMTFAVSAPSRDAVELAGAIHEIKHDP